MKLDVNPDSLAANHGVSPLDTSRTVAFSAVAAGGVYKGRNYLAITVGSTSTLKKHMCVYIVAGTYAGIHRIARIVSSTVLWIYTDIAFDATAAGNLAMSAHLEGFGFWVDAAPTIAEFEGERPNDDTTGIIATTFVVGVYYPYPFKKIRISAGKITVVRKPFPAKLTYTNTNK